MRRTPPTGVCTLATLEEPGWDELVAAAPGHVEAVRRLVFDPLTGRQHGQLRSIGQRILRGIDASAATAAP